MHDMLGTQKKCGVSFTVNTQKYAEEVWCFFHSQSAEETVMCGGAKLLLRWLT